MEQHVHDISVGNRSNTFRGTWGYIHVPDPALLQTLNLEDLTLKAYLDSLERARDFTINPLHFMPTCEARESEVDVWKSQIAKVLMEHLAVPSDRSKAISTSPQALDQISHTLADNPHAEVDGRLRQLCRGYWPSICLSSSAIRPHLRTFLRSPPAHGW
ncbi:hypothetical protein PSTG_18722 [Puccinia striiformis f. sp. tritici PST-78]|uniref:Uncharacterized protein n=1 Tax=Puccinia striiformis f. sp. tritici PST-78 TaxID=1165861 RepID=A0A0L0ULC2_9BASI|nr:hypothetical protein PSTG_18722 [Puccinia striiformis f. sp. tritici PST-78]